MNIPIIYNYEISLRDFKKMLGASNFSIVKMETEFPNQKAFNVFENGKHLYYILFTGRVDEWKIVHFNLNNPLVSRVIMNSNRLELYEVTNLSENYEYKIWYGMLREPLGIVWALNYWGYLK